MKNEVKLTEDWPEKMDCLVLGGCADGAYLRNIRSDADTVRLARPKHLMPLKSSTQQQPEIEKEQDIYHIHVFDMPVSSQGKQGIRRIIGIAVVERESLAWGMKQIMLAYLEKKVRQMKEDSQQVTTH